MVFLYAIGAVALLLLVLDRLDFLVTVPWWGQLLAGTAAATVVTLLGHGPLVSVPSAVFFAGVLLTAQKTLAGVGERPARPRKTTFTNLL